MRPDERRRGQVLGQQPLRPARQRLHDQQSHAGRRVRPYQRRHGDRRGWPSQLRPDERRRRSAGGTTPTASSATARLPAAQHRVDVAVSRAVSAWDRRGRIHTLVPSPSGGGVKCWGDGLRASSAAGSPNQSYSVDVTRASPAESPREAGRFHTCAPTTGGGVKCWGRRHVCPGWRRVNRARRQPG